MVRSSGRAGACFLPLRVPSTVYTFDIQGDLPFSEDGENGCYGNVVPMGAGPSNGPQSLHEARAVYQIANGERGSTLSVLDD